VVAQLQVPTTTAGYAQLLAWAGSAVGEGRAVWAVEGTRHYGLGLARHLASAGEQVSEIDASLGHGDAQVGQQGDEDGLGAMGTYMSLRLQLLWLPTILGPQLGHRSHANRPRLTRDPQIRSLDAGRCDRPGHADHSLARSRPSQHPVR
jgi:hypothetical protein